MCSPYHPQVTNVDNPKISARFLQGIEKKGKTCRWGHCVPHAPSCPSLPCAYAQPRPVIASLPCRVALPCPARDDMQVVAWLGVACFSGWWVDYCPSVHQPSGVYARGVGGCSDMQPLGNQRLGDNSGEDGYAVRWQW